MRRGWLRLHDKHTAGIMALLALVHGMPMRLTSSEDPGRGASKKARVQLIGWELSETERKRIDESLDPEVVLEERPLRLILNFAHPTDGNDSGIFELQPQVRIWTRDVEGNAQVRRIGFPLVPEFGGTVHAYCGVTLNASIGDLLPW